MHYVKKFNRFELKYIIPYKQAVTLMDAIAAYTHPDPYKSNGEAYLLSSLYYDSPDHRFYWEKIDGLKYRRKVRVRWYTGEEPLNDDTIVFLEIKQRVDRVTQKRRIALPYKEVMLFYHEGIVPELLPEDHDTIEELESLRLLFNLQPSAITTYYRKAFVGSDYDLGLRITFDMHMTYRERDLYLGAGSYDGFILPPNYVVMEIKTNERIPYWVTELVAGNNLQLIRVSKYCLGLEKALTGSQQLSFAHA